MYQLTFILVLLLIPLSVSQAQKLEENQAEIETLQLVQVIFRHGDRAPTRTYPNDPLNNDTSVWPEGLAQLTSIGKMQQYNLGRYLRHRYNGFLSSKYHSQELYVVSSDMDRTIMSVESNLAGLFPPGKHKWHPYIDWQPIPLRTIPWKEDHYLHVNTRCPKYEMIHRDFLQNAEIIKAINEENKGFIQLLSEKSGLKGDTVRDVLPLQDIILTEMLHNLSLRIPQWAIDALPKLNELQALENTWGTYTNEMKRLRGGPLLGLLLKNMQAKKGTLWASSKESHLIVGGGKRKMLMYSAHDSTLARIMNTMGIFHPHNPPYAAALFLELHLEPGHPDYYVRVFYRNETDRAPHELELAYCPSPCYLSSLILATEHLVPLDLEKECKIKEEEEDKRGQEPLLLMAVPTAYNNAHKKRDDSSAPMTCISGISDPLGYVAVIVSVGCILFTVMFFLWICLCRFLGCSKDDLPFQERLIYPRSRCYEKI